MANQEIGLKVDTGQAESNLNKTAAAAENLEGKLQGVVDGTQVAGTAIEKLGTSASTADVDLADLAKSINTFLVERGKLAGKAPRLLDTKQDQQALQELKQQFQEMLNTTPSIRTDVLAANKGKIPSIPSQVNMAGYSPDPKKQADLMERMITRLLSHNLVAGKPIDTGLSAVDLNLRSLSRRPHEDDGPPDPTKPHQPKTHSSVLSAAQHISKQAIAGGAGGAVGQAAGAAMQGASSGAGGLGLVGGGLLGLAGFAAFKAASGVSEGLDRAKAEAIEVDRFKRQLGDVGVGFDVLREHLRSVSEGLGLTFEQSRKLAATFAQVADTRSKDEKGLSQEARVAGEFSRATGISADVLAKFFGEMRAGHATENAQDSKRMALAMADAIKRSGSPVNADQMLQSIASYTAQIRDATLGKVNATGYADILSGMVSDGMKSTTASGIFNRFDQSFRSGGGEVEDAFTFQALGGNRLGAGKTMALRDAGLMASEKSVFGDPNNPIAKFYGVDKSASSETNLSKVMKSFDQQYMNTNDPQSKDAAALSLAHLMKTTQAQAMGFYQSYKEHGEAGLTKTSDMMERFGIKPDRVNGPGVALMSNIANENSISGLQGLRSGMLKRDDISPGDKKKLEAAEKETNTEVLRELLARTAVGLDQEKTDGQKLNDATVKLDNDLTSFSTSLIPISEKSRDLLAELVRFWTPENPVLIEMDTAKLQKQLSQEKEDIKKGALPESDVKRLNKKYDEDAKEVIRNNPGPLKEEMRNKGLTAVERLRYADLGAKAVPLRDEVMHGGLNEDQLKKIRETQDAAKANSGEGLVPRMVPKKTPPSRLAVGKITNEPTSAEKPTSGTVTPEMDAKMLANDAALAKINPDWKPGMTRAQFQVESKFSPDATSTKGAQGYSQIMPATRKLFEKREGRTFKAGDFDDDLELQRLHMTDDLKREGNVPDALRAYNAGPDKSKWGSKETAVYVGKVESALAKQSIPESQTAAVQQPVRVASMTPDAASARIPGDRSMILPPEPVQIPSGNPQEAAEASRRSLELSMNPITVNSKVTLFDQQGQQRADPVMQVSKINKPMSSGYAAGGV
jgi:hypothetical protein